MQQLNERSAGTLAEWAESDHLARMKQSRGLPATRPAPIPATAPAALPPARERTVVRMILLDRPPADLARFEIKAIAHFKQQPEGEPYFKTQRNKEGTSSYRYARALYAQGECVACHPPSRPRPVAAKPPAGVRPELLGLVSVEIPYQIDANQAFLNRLFIFAAGLLAGTLAIIVFYLITTRLILEPVRVLQETAEKVSGGDLNIRSHISTGDEFQQLAETFNKMLANLQESEDQLRAINTSLDLKLGQLSESNLALHEANRLKSEFLANVSHELRTPLNSILGFADLLKDGAIAQDAKGVRYLQNIINSGKHLLGLITDLLDLAKIEAGRMEVHCEPLSLSDLFEGLINIIKPLAEKKELTLAATVASDVPIVQTDPAKLQQILYNFLSNAIKFSPNQERIDLRADRAAENAVKISVIDRGPGIPFDKQSVIFEKFRQIDGSVTREHGGTGLGLAISKELTTLLGGDIGVQSAPNEGSAFWITLPVKVESPADPAKLPAAAVP